MRTVIQGGQIVNEGQTVKGAIFIEDGIITDIIDNPQLAQESICRSSSDIIDATGCFVLPGIIDDHVHFREPGMTEKADIASESRAAAAGGVTSYFDMPNCIPQTTTLESLDDKFCRAKASSLVNYSFFFGATSGNIDTFSRLDTSRIPGIKLFMGSSTGNMLVDRDEVLEHIFKNCRLPLMAHCEDTAIINHNMADAKEAWGEDPPVSLHALIRSEEACLASTRKAVEMARRYGTRLHVAHLSTAEELDLFEPYSVRGDAITTHITAEACVGHLFFTQLDHERLGALIKVNPSIKTPVDQFMLRKALSDGRIATVATDHAPHLLTQKQGGCVRSASGMPMVQFSLVTMLELVDRGVLTLPRLVELMCHNPARLFGVEGRGFLRPGYHADITIVRPHTSWTVTSASILSKCGWSPFEGHEYQWRVERTLCNGHSVYAGGRIDDSVCGQELRFVR